MRTILGPEYMNIEGGVDDKTIAHLIDTVRREYGHDSWRATGKKLMTMLIFSAPALIAAEEVRSAEGGQMFVYEYQYDKGWLGAAHAVEVPLVFGTHKLAILGRLAGVTQNPEKGERLAAHVRSAFASFARDGTPCAGGEGAGGGAGPGPRVWPEYGDDGAHPMYVVQNALFPLPSILRVGVYCESGPDSLLTLPWYMAVYQPFYMYLTVFSLFSPSVSLYFSAMGSARRAA